MQLQWTFYFCIAKQSLVTELLFLRGICVKDKENEQNKIIPLLDSLSNAYSAIVKEDLLKREFFGLRDFYRFVNQNEVIKLLKIGFLFKICPLCVAVVIVVVIFYHFNSFLQIHLTYFNHIWHKSSFGKKGFKLKQDPNVLKGGGLKEWKSWVF